MHPNGTTLNDYVDGSLGPVERHEADRHLAGCAACRQAVEDLREIVGLSKELELREPPVRAWSRLERALQMEEKGARKRGTAPFLWFAAAAALALATAIGMRDAPFHIGAPPAEAPGIGAAIGAGDAAQSIETELRQAETHYEKAIKGLEAIANSEQGELDPRTAATLQKNLAVIDQAISESRAAVRQQPANEPAQQSLIEGFKTKIGLLQDTVALINEMRKGNEAGAARIASGLKQKGT
jgi:anti-sigma factor RsiW